MKSIIKDKQKGNKMTNETAAKSTTRLLASHDNVIEDINEDIFNKPRVKTVSTTQLLASSVPLEPRVFVKKPKKAKAQSKVKVIAARNPELIKPREPLVKKAKQKRYVLMSTEPVQTVEQQKELFAEEVSKHVLSEKDMKTKIEKQQEMLDQKLKESTETKENEKDSQIKPVSSPALGFFKKLHTFLSN